MSTDFVNPTATPINDQSQASPPLPFKFDDAHVKASYANFCRVTGTPEEVIVDFGLNPQPVGLPSQPIAVTDRIVMNFYSAKRMLLALQATIERHEQAFGVLETEVAKRLKS